ncbi:MAG: ATP-binding cassette domain-containing protein, partial [Acetatifactor sp.]|nr:ATP-binding cassette domain-containing protein [Acetatifactor sp.]
MENKLHVQDLRISFRTSNGKVQAVRGIDFDLAKGETLAIVGESGSGKSVTSKAILGILAGNSIVESGEIIYDGQDLLKISEEDFHKIRGDRIAMIFQDPMSSLNPIARIGRQRTEAMLLKGRIRQRESRRSFNAYLKNLRDMMAASAANDAERGRAAVSCKKFQQFEKKHTELESAYNIAHEGASEALDDIGIIAFELEKNTV